MSKRGKFVVIDGGDGSGKYTQMKRLEARLLEVGTEVVLADFPQYGTKAATFVEMYLGGEFGSLSEVDAYQASIFYAADRFEAAPRLNTALAEGKWVISNRYVSANKGHQTAKLDSEMERFDFIKWLNELEYGIFKIPVPDLTIFLHVPAEIGYQLVLQKDDYREYLDGKKQDIHEADPEHLRRAEEAYLEMAEGGIDTYENWVKVSCCDDGGILPVDIIGDKVYKLVRQQLG